jgi:hypothetical protein
MARAPCTFKQRDVTAAVKAVLAAGIEVQRVEVDQDGKIAIITGKAEESRANGENEWDAPFLRILPRRGEDLFLSPPPPPARAS